MTIDKIKEVAIVITSQEASVKVPFESSPFGLIRAVRTVNELNLALCEWELVVNDKTLLKEDFWKVAAFLEEFGIVVKIHPDFQIVGTMEAFMLN